MSDDAAEFEAAQVHADPPEDANTEPVVLHGPWLSADGTLCRVLLENGKIRAPYRYVDLGSPWRPSADIAASRDLAAELARLAAENRELREDRDALKMTVEEGSEIESELIGALAFLTEEELKPCAAGACPGHLGERARAMIRSARVAWNELEAERDQARAALAAREREADRLRALVARQREWIASGGFSEGRVGDVWPVLDDLDGQAAEAWLVERERPLRARIALLSDLADDAAEIILALRSGYVVDAETKGGGSIAKRLRDAAEDPDGLNVEAWLEGERVMAAEPWKAAAGRARVAMAFFFPECPQCDRRGDACACSPTCMEIFLGARQEVLEDPAALTALSWLSAREASAREEGRREGLKTAVTIAKGCQDYGGGYRSEPEKLAAFHHGIDTVAAALQAKTDNPGDTQVAAVEAYGSRLEALAEKPEPSTSEVDRLAQVDVLRAADGMGPAPPREPCPFGEWWNATEGQYEDNYVQAKASWAESARQERLACAALVRAAGCACLDFWAAEFEGRGTFAGRMKPILELAQGGGYWSELEVDLHDPRCPTALADAIEGRGHV